MGFIIKNENNKDSINNIIDRIKDDINYYLSLEIYRSDYDIYQMEYIMIMSY